MLVNLDLRNLLSQGIEIPWKTGFEELDRKADCFLYQILPREKCPLSELIITPIPFRCWPDVWEIKMTVHEHEGILARLAHLMGDRNINILMANSITIDQSRSHVIRLVVDCSRYQSPLDGEFSDRIKKTDIKLTDLKLDLVLEFIEDISFTRREPVLSINRNITYWSLFQRKTESIPIKEELSIIEGSVMLNESNVLKHIRKSYSSNYGVVFKKSDIPLALVSFEEYSDLIRIFIFYRNLGIIWVTISLENLPGAIAEAASFLQKNKFNILASRAWNSKNRTFMWLLLQDLTKRFLPIEDQRIVDKVEAILLDESTFLVEKYDPEFFPPGSIIK